MIMEITQVFTNGFKICIPLVKYFCETTGQKLVVDDDTTTGATYRRNSDPDAVSGASTKAEKVEKTKKQKNQILQQVLHNINIYQ
jgi:hypothetical protein